MSLEIFLEGVELAVPRIVPLIVAAAFHGVVMFISGLSTVASGVASCEGVVTES